MKDGKLFIANSDQDKADVLATFFTSVFTQETDENFDKMENINFESLSSDDEFKPEEVKTLLNELDTSKSPGPDQVHPIVLSKLSDIIQIPMCHIFNSSFKSGIVPNEWKIGQITALFKKGDKKLASN